MQVNVHRKVCSKQRKQLEKIALCSEEKTVEAKRGYGAVGFRQFSVTMTFVLPALIRISGVLCEEQLVMEGI